MSPGKMFRLLLMVGAMIIFGGCGVVQDSLKETKRVFETYVEPSPEVSLDASMHGEAEEKKLARLFTPVDRRLEALSRYMGGRDAFPDKEWVTSLIENHSWINGLTAVNIEGEPYFTQSRETLIELDVKDMLGSVEDWSERELQVGVQSTETGSMMWMAHPFFHDDALKGVLCAHFDMESLMRFSPEPEKLIVFDAEKKLLWGGEASQNALARNADWERILRDEVVGRIRVAGKQYLWLARYVANKPIIYASAE